jgi:hypothetical protein
VPKRGPVVINLPAGKEAGYRAALSQQFEFTVQDYLTSATVEPREGSGVTNEYFTATRLCSAGDVLTQATWDPLRQLDPHPHDPATCKALLEWANEHLLEDPDNLWRQLRVLRARTLVLGKELPEFLAKEAPRFFEGMPGGSLWLVTVDELLVWRLSFLRVQLAFTLTPDLPVVPPEFQGFHLLSAHGLTRGAEFGGALALPLLAFSPGAIGMPLSWTPHALVLVFGQTLDLHKPEVDSPSYIYRPHTFGRPEGWSDPPFWQKLSGADVEPLIPWWVERLNILYSHATDPTQFSDELGLHDAGAQAAWYLTLERMLVDATLMLAEPGAADIVRMQLAFDILDKSEALLGYPKSGPGFKDLLRRSKTLPRLRQAWKSLPPHLEHRFRKHSLVTFDALYEDIRNHTLANRLTKRGVLVGGDPNNLRSMPMDEYVGSLLREVRNSAHGLKRILRKDERFLVATHTGDVPRQLPDLAALIALALVADADKMCAGSWW